MDDRPLGGAEVIDDRLLMVIDDDESVRSTLTDLDGWRFRAEQMLNPDLDWQIAAADGGPQSARGRG